METLEGMKTVRISDETHERLGELGKYSNTMDDIIRTLLDFWDSKHKDRGYCNRYIKIQILGLIKK